MASGIPRPRALERWARRIVPSSKADLPERIIEFLSRRGGSASSLLLADRFLQLGAIDEALATRLMAPLLEPRGLRYAPESGWRLSWTAGEGAEQDASLPIPKFEEEAIRQVACAVEPSPGDGGRSRASAIRSLSIQPPSGDPPVEMTPGGDGRSGAAQLRAGEWRRLGSLLDGAEAIFIDPRREAPLLLAELARRGLRGPGAVRSLSGAVRGVVPLRRGSRPEEIAAALGAPWLDEGSAHAAAVNVASCLAAARRARAAAGPEARAVDERDREAPQACAFSPAALAEAPGKPGIYRFLGEGDSLIYVGKSSNLKRRLAAYAAEAASPSRGAGRKVTRSLHLVRRVEWRVLGSELEAILEEARMITRGRPSSNVQRAVRERGRSYAPGRMHAYLLPGKEPGAVIALFASRGAFGGACRIGPRGGGLVEAREGRELSPETELMNSWLARHGETVSRVELDACKSARHAEVLLEAAIREAGKFGGEPTYHR